MLRRSIFGLLLAQNQINLQFYSIVSCVNVLKKLIHIKLKSNSNLSILFSLYNNLSLNVLKLFQVLQTIDDI